MSLWRVKRTFQTRFKKKSFFLIYSSPYSTHFETSKFVNKLLCNWMVTSLCTMELFHQAVKNLSPNHQYQTPFPPPLPSGSPTLQYCAGGGGGGGVVLGYLHWMQKFHVAAFIHVYQRYFLQFWLDNANIQFNFHTNTFVHLRDR